MTKQKKCKSCNKNAIPGIDFCMPCFVENMIENKIRESSDNGNIKDILVNGIAGIAFQVARPIVENVTNSINGDSRVEKKIANNNTRNPFDILGLDIGTATIKDVRIMQRRLASIYHQDKKTSGIDSSKMSQLNCAAEECIRIIKNRK